MLQTRFVPALFALCGYSKGASPVTNKVGGKDFADAMQATQVMADGWNSWFQNQLALPVDRYSVYRELDAMDADDILSSALDLYTEDTLRANSVTNRLIWIESENSDIKKICENLIRDLRIEETAYEDVRSLIKYGDLFKVLIQGVNEHDIPVKITGAKAVAPYTVNVARDVYGRVRGFEIGTLASGSIITSNRDTKIQTALMPWEIVHFKLPGRNLDTSYGTSILFPCRRVWRILQMMENAMAVYRLKRAPDRLKWKVDTGGSDPTEAAEWLQLFKNSVQKKMFVDGDENRTRTDINTWDVLDDIFLPVNENSKTDVEVMSGSSGNIGNVLDIEYMRKRLFSVLRIPPDYLGYTESSGTLNANTPLADQDVRYSKTIKKIQHGYMSGVMRTLQIALIVQGHDITRKSNEFRVQMNPVSYLEEQQAADVAKTRAETLISLLDAGKEIGFDTNEWREYVSTLSGFPEAVMKTLKESKKIDKNILTNIVSNSILQENRTSLSSQSCLNDLYDATPELINELDFNKKHQMLLECIVKTTQDKQKEGVENELE